ncbi:MAG: peptidoglycan DD-metalloendopeptidase family protein [Pseudomonadota bacterium]
MFAKRWMTLFGVCLTLLSATTLADRIVEEPAAGPEDGWYSHVISAGESLSYIFQQYDVSAATLATLLRNATIAQHLTRIRPGQIVHLLKDQQQRLVQLILVRSPRETLHIQAQQPSGFTVTMDKKPVTTRVASAAGVIQSSLFLDGQRAGLSDAKIMELVDLFRWDIDFALDLRPGDQFRLVYEEQVLEGRKWRDGPILAAEFIHRGEHYHAFRYQDSQGDIDYYNAQGYNKKRSFIRSPIPLARVSSGFSKRRWHPVLKRWRAHRGVDYAAPTGTPIKVTGKGKVSFVGWKKGYGRTVMVQHGKEYQTLYAHLSRFADNLQVGQRVAQSEVIGYVGQTGLATGPHLHYEFRVNGVHRNPLTLKLPRALRLKTQQLAAFQRQIAPLSDQLADLEPAIIVAKQTPYQADH